MVQRGLHPVAGPAGGGRAAAGRRRTEGHPMGDKSPKAKDKAKKQDTKQKKQDRAAHDAKQAPAAPSLGKGKGR
jgi:hypothetical protein